MLEFGSRKQTAFARSRHCVLRTPTKAQVSAPYPATPTFPWEPSSLRNPQAPSLHFPSDPRVLSRGWHTLAIGFPSIVLRSCPGSNLVDTLGSLRSLLPSLDPPFGFFLFGGPKDGSHGPFGPGYQDGHCGPRPIGPCGVRDWHSANHDTAFPRKRVSGWGRSHNQGGCRTLTKRPEYAGHAANSSRLRLCPHTPFFGFGFGRIWRSRGFGWLGGPLPPSNNASQASCWRISG